MATIEITSARSRFISVEGIRTHYLDAGDGPTVVLLHDGSYGAGAELCWALNVDALARTHRVIAPDWLGFGDTDKLYDFGGGRARRLWHMTRFLQTFDVDSAAFIGSSMGASLLLQIAASGEQPWPINAIVSVSGGGFLPLNEARRQSLDFDCTRAGMRAVLSAIVHDRRWLEEEWLVGGRFEAAIRPGAWEAVAAARFKSPITPSKSEFGNEDKTPYERIGVPTLIVAGADDKLRNPGYAGKIAARIPNSELRVFEDCGHFPQIEHHEEFNALVADFLKRRTA
jgi:pimeloyl-ACP methyl ester carboxylesterase